MEVTLPGGLHSDQGLQTRAQFRPLSGRVEQALFDFRQQENQPAFVSQILAEALDTIGEFPATMEAVGQLSIPDRQYLMVRLAALLEGEHVWLKIHCVNCDAPFDAEFNRCDLPVEKAAHGFPFCNINIDDRELSLRVPNGRDQEDLLKLSEVQAQQLLLQRCIKSLNGAVPSSEALSTFSSRDVAIIEQALEEISPSVCSGLLLVCPECDKEQRAAIDHYRFSDFGEVTFYDEIHTIASHYHWSEADILDLPRTQRQRYVGLINRSTGGGA